MACALVSTPLRVSARTARKHTGVRAEAASTTRVFGRVCQGSRAGMLGAFSYLTTSPQAVENLRHVGYSQQLRVVLGIAKLAGALVLLLPRLPTLKAWAYAGFTITWIAATRDALSGGRRRPVLAACRVDRGPRRVVRHAVGESPRFREGDPRVARRLDPRQGSDTRTRVGRPSIRLNLMCGAPTILPAWQEQFESALPAIYEKRDGSMSCARQRSGGRAGGDGADGLCVSKTRSATDCRRSQWGTT